MRRKTQKDSLGLFDNLSEEIDKIAREGSIFVELSNDYEGYLDRRCPRPECERLFKVRGDDWQDKVSDSLTCPVCGHVAPLDDWATPEQQDYASVVAKYQVELRTYQAMKKDERASRRRSRSRRRGMINLDFSFTAPRSPPKPPAGYAAMALMQTKTACPGCECSFGCVGTGFYCPACGDHLAQWRAATDAMRKRAASIPELRASFEEFLGVDGAEDEIRALLENSLKDAVSVFEAFTGFVFATQTCVVEDDVRMPNLQNLGNASDAWELAGRQRYEQLVTKVEYERLEIFFQRRHKLGHTGGRVDQRYLDRCSDRTYQLGERIQVSADDLVELAGLVEKILGVVETWREGPGARGQSTAF